MKKVIWTTIFWLVIFALFVLYIKTFSDLGTKVSSWLTTPVTISGEVTTGAQDEIMSGLLLLQTTTDDMNKKLDAISTKL